MISITNTKITERNGLFNMAKLSERRKVNNAKWNAENPEVGKKATAKSGAKRFIKNSLTEEELIWAEELIAKKWNGDEIK